MTSTILFGLALYLGLGIIFKKLIFEPRDLWIGVYWNDVEVHGAPADMHVLLSRYPYVMYPRRLYIYICLIPMFPLRFIRPLRKWRPGVLDERQYLIVEP